MATATEEPKAETPAATAAETPPAPKTLTLEELDARNQVTLADLGYAKRKPKNETEGTRTDAPAASPAETTTPTTAQPAEIPAKEEDEGDAKETKRRPYAERVADRIEERLAAKIDALKPTETPAPKDTAPQLSARDLRERRILEVLAEQPEYNGIVQQFDKFVPAEAAYRAKWEAANPDAEYDSEAEEHGAFYKKNQPAYDEEDFTDAHIEMATRDKIGALEAKREHERVVQDAVSKIKDTQLSVTEELIKTLDPEIKAKTLTELKTKDEDLFDVLEEKVPLLQALATETELLLNNPKLGYKFDNSNPIHQQWVERFTQYQADFAAKPAKDSKWDGRDFVTLQEFATLSEAEKKQAWTLLERPDEVKRLLVNEFSSKLKPKVERWRKNRPAPASNGSPSANGDKSATPAPAAENRRSPSMPDAGDRVPVNGISEKKTYSAFTDLYPGR